MHINPASHCPLVPQGKVQPPELKRFMDKKLSGAAPPAATVPTSLTIFRQRLLSHVLVPCHIGELSSFIHKG